MSGRGWLLACVLSCVGRVLALDAGCSQRPLLSSASMLEYLECIRRPSACADSGAELFEGSAPLCEQIASCDNAIYIGSSSGVLKFQYHTLCPKRCGFCDRQRALLNATASFGESSSVRLVRRVSCGRVGLRPLRSAEECAAAAEALGWRGKRGIGMDFDQARPEGCSMYLRGPSYWVTFGPLLSASKGNGGETSAYQWFYRASALNWEERFQFCTGSRDAMDAAALYVTGELPLAEPRAEEGLLSAGSPLLRWMWVYLSAAVVAATLWRCQARLRAIAAFAAGVARSAWALGQVDSANERIVWEKLRYTRRRFGEVLAYAMVAVHTAQLVSLAQEPSTACDPDGIVLLQASLLLACLVASAYLSIDDTRFPNTASMVLLPLTFAEYFTQAVQTIESKEMTLLSSGKLAIRTAVLHLVCGACLPPAMALLNSCAYATTITAVFGRLVSPGQVAVVTREGWFYDCLQILQAMNWSFFREVMTLAFPEIDPDLVGYTDVLAPRIAALREFGIALLVAAFLLSLHWLLVQDLVSVLRADKLQKGVNALSSVFSRYCDALAMVDDELAFTQPSITFAGYIHGNCHSQAMMGRRVSEYLTDDYAARLTKVLLAEGLGARPPVTVQLKDAFGVVVRTKIAATSFVAADGRRAHLLALTEVRNAARRDASSQKSSSSRAPSSRRSSRSGGGGGGGGDSNEPRFTMELRSTKITACSRTFIELVGGEPEGLDSAMPPDMAAWLREWLAQLMSLTQMGALRLPHVSPFGSVLLGTRQSPWLGVLRVAFPAAGGNGPADDYAMHFSVMQLRRLDAPWEAQPEAPQVTSRRAGRSIESL